MPKYRANVGMNFPDPKNPGEEIRVEAGELLDHLPVPWLLQQGYVSEADPAAPVDVTHAIVGDPVKE